MLERASTRLAPLMAAILAGLGLTAAIIGLLGAPIDTAMAASPASGPRQPMLDAAAGITLSKDAPVTAYQSLGAEQTLIPYTLTLHNPSAFTIADDAVITDQLALDTVLLGGTTGPGWLGSFPADGTVVTYLRTSDTSDTHIDVGGYHAALDVPVRDGSVFVNEHYCFTGTVNGTPQTFCEHAPVTTTVRAPDFSLVEGTSIPICAGASLTYTLTLTNPGGVRTTLPITLTGQITPLLEVITDTISDGGAWNAHTFTWTISSPALQPDGGNQVTRTFAVTIPAATAHGTLLTNTYVVTSPEVLPNISLWHSSGVTVTRVTAAFSSTTSSCQHDQVTFYNNTTGASSYEWDFGDGSPSSSQFAPTHVYTSPGTYTTTLTATGVCGTDVTTQTITIHPLPAPLLQVTPDPTQLGMTTYFTDAGSGGAAWNWDFGDGTGTSTAMPHVTHTYTGSPASRTVVLTATSSQSCYSTTTYPLQVDPGMPYTVSLEAAPSELPVGTGAAVTATVTDQWGNLVLDGTPITFTAAPPAVIAPPSDPTSGGLAHATVTSTLAGPTLITGTASSGAFGTTVVTFTAGAPHTVTLTADPLAPTVGTAAALTATVVDQYANPVPGQVVTFTTSDDLGSGTLAPQTDTTGGLGQARSAVTSTLVGPKTVLASVASLSDITVVTFTPGAPHTVTLTADPLTPTVGTAAALTATVTDRFGNVVPGQTVTFTTGDPLGSGGISPASDATDGNGQATSAISSTLPGIKAVTAAHGTLSDTVQVDFSAADPFTVSLTATPDTLTVGESANLTATVTDRFGNPITGDDVRFSTGDLGLGGFSPTIDTTDAAGQATSIVSSTRSGLYLIQARELDNGITGTATVDWTPGPAHAVTLTATPSSLPVGNSAALTATVVDQYANPVPGQVVTFTTSDSLGGGTIAPQTDAADALGQAHSAISSTLVGPKSILASANSVSDTATVTFTPGSPDAIALTASPLTLTVGETAALTATVTDHFGNAAPGHTITFTTSAPLGLGAISPESDLSDGSGESTSSISSTVPGIKAVTAGDGTLSDTVEITFDPGSLATITIAPDPATLTVGRTQAFTASGFDAYGNPLTITPTWSTDVGAIDPGPTATSVFTAQTTPATGSITATQGAVTGAAVVDIVPSAAASIELSPATAVTAAGESQAYTVTARDTYGNPWDVTASAGFAISPAAAGLWTNNVYTAEIAGTWTVTATYGGLQDRGTLTVTHAPTATSAVLSPNPYTLEAGQQVVYSLTALDIYDNSWDATASGTYTVTPGAGGSWTNNVYTSQYTGTWQVTATVPNATDVALLTVTETVPSSRIYLPLVMRDYTRPEASLDIEGFPISLPVGETAVLTATALDEAGSPITGMVVAFSTSDPLGTGALTPSNDATDANGQVTATLRSTVEGFVEVKAEASNSTSDSTFVTFLSSQFCAPQLVAVAETGPSPRQIAIDSVGRRAFVAHYDGVTVLDLDTFEVITEVASVAAGHGIAYDPDRDHIWVTHRSARVLVLDGTDYTTLANLPASSGPYGVAYNPTNARVYVTSFWDWVVDVYDAEALTRMTQVANVEEPAYLGVNPLTNKIYVANHRVDHHVTVIDGATHDSHHIGTALIDPYGVTVDSTRSLIYVSSILQGRISVISGTTDLQMGHLDVRHSTGDIAPLRVIAINPDVGPEGHLFATTSSHDGEPDRVLLIPNGWPSLGTPVPLDIPSYPMDGIALDPVTDRIWVTNVSSGAVSVIQDGTPVCTRPFALEETEREDGYHIRKFITPHGITEF